MFLLPEWLPPKLLPPKWLSQKIFVGQTNYIENYYFLFQSHFNLISSLAISTWKFQINNIPNDFWSKFLIIIQPVSWWPSGYQYFKISFIILLIQIYVRSKYQNMKIDIISFIHFNLFWLNFSFFLISFPSLASYWLTYIVLLRVGWFLPSHFVFTFIHLHCVVLVKQDKFNLMINLN